MDEYKIVGKKSRLVVFDTSKQESHHPGQGFKKLGRWLKGIGCKVRINKENLVYERLNAVHLLILGCPRSKFSSEEVRYSRFAKQSDSL